MKALSLSPTVCGLLLWGCQNCLKDWRLVWEVVIKYSGVLLHSVLKQHTAVVPAKGRQVHLGVQSICWSCPFSLLFARGGECQLVLLHFPIRKEPFQDFPDSPVVKNPPCNAGDIDSIFGQGTKIPHAVEQLSSWAREPSLQLESLCAAMKGPTWCKEDPVYCN